MIYFVIDKNKFATSVIIYDVIIVIAEWEMDLRVAAVHIKGFRSLGNVEVELAEYSSLIGRNDGGKSSFLHALHILFDPERVPIASDFCKIDNYSGEFSIQASLVECAGHEDLVTDGKIQVRCIFREDKWHWEVLGQVPRDETIKKIVAGSLLRGEWNSATHLSAAVKTVVNGALHELSPGGRISAKVWGEISSILIEGALIEWEEGWGHLNKERLSSLVTVVMLEADMRGEEELADGGKSVFNRVGGLLLREATKNHPDMTAAMQQLNEAVQKVATADEDDNWLIPELNNFQRVMQEEVGRFDNSISAQSSLIPPKIPPMEFSVKVEVSDQWIKGLDKMGHGLRRSIVFAMLRTHHRLRAEEAEELSRNTPSRVPLYLFLVEEPELYLHPQAERKRMEELRELANLNGTQVVLCTHSAIFVDLREYRGILRFARPNRNFTQVRGWSGGPLDDDAKKMLTMVYQFDANRAAMLFAEQVILVEGPSEKTMLPYFAKKLNLSREDKEIVDCDGDQNIKVYQRILEGFGIRYVAWIDTDEDKPRTGDRPREWEVVKRGMSPDLGKLILAHNNWEQLMGVPTGKKPSNSWSHFVDNKNELSELAREKLKAAFTWENHEAACIEAGVSAAA